MLPSCFVVSLAFYIYPEHWEGHEVCESQDCNCHYKVNHTCVSADVQCDLLEKVKRGHGSIVILIQRR